MIIDQTNSSLIQKLKIRQRNVVFPNKKNKIIKIFLLLVQQPLENALVKSQNVKKIIVNVLNLDNHADNSADVLIAAIRFNCLNYPQNINKIKLTSVNAKKVDVKKNIVYVTQTAENVENNVNVLNAITTYNSKDKWNKNSFSFKL